MHALLQRGEFNVERNSDDLARPIIRLVKGFKECGVRFGHRGMGLVGPAEEIIGGHAVKIAKPHYKLIRQGVRADFPLRYRREVDADFIRHILLRPISVFSQFP